MIPLQLILDEIKNERVDLYQYLLFVLWIIYASMASYFHFFEVNFCPLKAKKYKNRKKSETFNFSTVKSYYFDYWIEFKTIFEYAWNGNIEIIGFGIVSIIFAFLKQLKLYCFEYACITLSVIFIFLIMAIILTYEFMISFLLSLVIEMFKIDFNLSFLTFFSILLVILPYGSKNFKLKYKRVSMKNDEYKNQQLKLKILYKFTSSTLGCIFSFFLIYSLFLFLFSTTSRVEFIYHACTCLYISGHISLFYFLIPSLVILFFCLILYYPIMYLLYILAVYTFFFQGYFEYLNSNVHTSLLSILRIHEEMDISAIEEKELISNVISDYNCLLSAVIKNFCIQNIEKYPFIFVKTLHTDEDLTFISLLPSFSITLKNEETGTFGNIFVHPSFKIGQLVYEIENFFWKKKERVNIIKTAHNLLKDRKLENLYLFEVEGIEKDCVIICNPLQSPMIGGGKRKRQALPSDGTRRSPIKRRKKRSNDDNKGDSIYYPNLNFPMTTYIENNKTFKTDRDSFIYLNLFDYITLQCFLFWKTQKDFPESVRRSKGYYLTAESAFQIVMKGQNIVEDHEIVTRVDIDKIKKIYDNKTLTLNHFLYDIRQNNSPQVYRDLSYTLTFLCNEHCDNNLIDVFDKIIKEAKAHSPELLHNLNIFKNFDLNFIVDSFNSLKTSLLQIEQMDAPKRTKSDQINIILTSILLKNNCAQFYNPSQLAQLLNTSRYYIKHAQNTVLAFQNNTIKYFKRNYKTREIFDPLVFQLIKEYYETKTIEAEGKQVVKIRRSGGLESEVISIRYLPCSIHQFYNLFCLDEDFGGKCRKLKDMENISWPSFTIFMQERPRHIKLMKKHGSGYCAICMQFEAYLFTFYSIIRNYCKCRKQDCPTFEHKHDCNFLEKPCNYCKECTCDTCEECEVPELNGSFSQFIKMMYCQKHCFKGRNYGDLNCITGKCKECASSSFDQSFFQKICPTVWQNIDWDTKIVTKKWKKIKIFTDVKKKKGFKSNALREKECTIREFFKIFHEFVTEKYGFGWHYHARHWQKANYLQMIRKMQQGEYGDEVALFLMDHAEAWKMMENKKKSSSQHYFRNLCQIFGLLEFKWTSLKKYESCTNYILSGYNVKKNAKYAIIYLKKKIEEYKLENPNLKYVHVWSDGSHGEFLNRYMFGNMINELPPNITIIWHYFSNNHGKNLCDSEFGVLKTKLDSVVGNESDGFQTVVEVFNFCKKFLNSNQWPRRGKCLLDRKFYYQEESIINYNNEYKAVKDVKLKRSVMWNQDRKCYRRFMSCSCETCMKPAKLEDICEKFSTICGAWEETEIICTGLREQLNEEEIKLKKIQEENDENEKEFMNIEEMKEDPDWSPKIKEKSFIPEIIEFSDSDFDSEDVSMASDDICLLEINEDLNDYAERLEPYFLRSQT